MKTKSAKSIVAIVASVMICLLHGSVTADAVSISNSNDLLTTASYFPLDSGMAWTYYSTEDGAETLTVMPGTEIVNGTATKKVEIQGGGHSPGSALYCSNDAAGVMIHKIYYPIEYSSGYGYTNMTVTLSPPLKVFNSVVALGDTIKSNGSAIYDIEGVGSYTFYYEATTTILAEEEVEVSAGSFATIKALQSLRIYGSINGRSVSDVSVDTVWYAANVGEVKSEDVDGEASQLTATNIFTGTAIPDIKANGFDGPLVVAPGEEIRVSVSLNPIDGTGTLANWWLIADSPFGWYSYVPPGIWQPGITPYVGSPLTSLNSVDLFQMPFPAGKTTLHFAVTGYREWIDSVEVDVSAAAAQP